MTPKEKNPMSKPTLDEILHQVRLPIDDPYWISPETAKAAILSLVPEGIDPSIKSYGRDRVQLNAGWNACRTEFLKRLREGK